MTGRTCFPHLPVVLLRLPFLDWRLACSYTTGNNEVAYSTRLAASHYSFFALRMSKKDLLGLSPKHLLA